MATLFGSPFSFADAALNNKSISVRCRDFLTAQKSNVKTWPSKINHYIDEVKSTRGARILVIDPQDNIAPQNWRHPFRFLNQIFINKPVEVVTEQIFYKKKHPTVLTFLALIALYYHVGVDVPLTAHSETKLTTIALAHAPESTSALENDLLYEGIALNLKAGKITQTEALRGAFALKTSLMTYGQTMQNIGQFDIANKRLVDDFKTNILFFQSYNLVSTYHLNADIEAQIYFKQHQYYIDMINLETYVDGQSLAPELVSGLFAGDYRQKLTAAFQGQAIDKNAFRYLIEKDIELKYEYQTNEILENASGIDLNPKKTLDEIHQGLLKQLKLN